MRDAEFYSYIEKREKIRLAREYGAPPPWTDDYILANFKFTNVKRIHDRTTKHFMEVYRRHSFSPEEGALLNCAVRRYFGTMAWSDFVGWQTNSQSILPMAEKAIASGIQIFTGAYVITNGGRAERKELVVAEYLSQLSADAHTIVTTIEEARTWESGYNLLRQLPGFGGTGFMAKEVLQDYLLWMGYRNDALKREPVETYIKDFYTFTPIGPGARRGLARVFQDPAPARTSHQVLASHLGALRAAVTDKFQQEFGLRLSAHDIQFCLCEFDKYERVRLGEGRPRSRYYPRAEQP